MVEQNFKFVEHLKNQLLAQPPVRKGERTRQRLILATATMLENIGFHALRVSDITDAAASSEGTFYIYFKDKRDVTRVVLEQFMGEMQLSCDMHGSHFKTRFETIRAANQRWLHVARANAGLMRCIFQVADEDQDFRLSVHARNIRLYERIARIAGNGNLERALGDEAVAFAVWALAAMTDELVRRVFVYPDPNLLDFLKKAKVGDDEISDALSVIWMRVLFPGHTLPASVSGLAQALARSA